MENTSTPALDQTAEVSPPKRRSILTRLLWIVTACSLFGMVLLFAWMQSTSRAIAVAQAQVAESRRRPPQNPIGQLSELAYGQTQSNYNPVINEPVPPFKNSGWQPYPSADVSYRTTQYPIAPSQSAPYGSNSEESQIESRIQQLALQYRNAEPGKKEGFNQTLNQVLSELFDARHKAQSSRVEALKMEVQQTQELLDKRLQNKAKIIERRLKELTGQQDELSWNASVPVASPSSPAEYIPRQTPIANPAYARNSTTVPTAGTPYPAPGYSMPFTTPSDSYPSPSPDSIPPPSSVSGNVPSQPIPPSGLNVYESLPSPNAVSTPTSVPVGVIPVSNNPVNVTLESQRSFMNIGFKLKGLMRQLEGEQSIKGLAKVKSEIEETKAVWEFEKSSLQSELESVEAEYQLVTKQLDQAREQVDIQLARVNAGTSADGKLDYSKAEVTKSEVERQLLQLRSRMTTLKKSIEWMENFSKEKPSSPPSTVGEPEGLSPRY
jgi:hypothetical protein